MVDRNSIAKSNPIFVFLVYASFDGRLSSLLCLVLLFLTTDTGENGIMLQDFWKFGLIWTCYFIYADFSGRKWEFVEVFVHLLWQVKNRKSACLSATLIRTSQDSDVLI